MSIGFEEGFACDRTQALQMKAGKAFCDNCQKQVYDARTWSREEISLKLLQAGGEMCMLLKESQLGDGIERALVGASKRKLRFWEILLLSIAFSFGLSQLGQAQTLSPIQQVYADYDAVCSQVHDGGFGGVIVKIDEEIDWDSLGLIDRQMYNGREIIVLSEPIFFLPNDTAICLTTLNNRIIPEMVRPWTTIFKSMEVIMSFPWKTVVIQGNADARETNDPMGLSLQRANFVAERLRYWGLQNKIEIKPMGASQPYEDLPYKDYEGKQRRVRIILMEPE